jgi:hypothetical protein
MAKKANENGKRIGDIISEHDALPPIKNVDEILNQELYLLDFESHESNLPGNANQGKLYYIMTVAHELDSEPFQVRTGAEVICRQLEALSKIDDLPMPWQIVKHGNTRMYKAI